MISRVSETFVCLDVVDKVMELRPSLLKSITIIGQIIGNLTKLCYKIYNLQMKRKENHFLSMLGTNETGSSKECVYYDDYYFTSFPLKSSASFTQPNPSNWNGSGRVLVRRKNL